MVVIEYVYEKEYERQSAFEKEDNIREADNERVRVSLTVQEELFKKMIQRDWMETGLDDEEYRTDSEVQQVSTKTKKKKKKNKSKKNKAEAQKESDGAKEGHEEEFPSASTNDTVVDEEKENVPASGGKKKDFFSTFCYILLK